MVEDKNTIYEFCFLDCITSILYYSGCLIIDVTNSVEECFRWLKFVLTVVFLFSENNI